MLWQPIWCSHRAKHKPFIFCGCVKEGPTSVPFLGFPICSVLHWPLVSPSLFGTNMKITFNMNVISQVDGRYSCPKLVDASALIHLSICTHWNPSLVLKTRKLSIFGNLGNLWGPQHIKFSISFGDLNNCWETRAPVGKPRQLAAGQAWRLGLHLCALFGSLRGLAAMACKSLVQTLVTWGGGRLMRVLYVGLRSGTK